MRTIICEEDIPNKPSEYKENIIYVSREKDRIGLLCLCGCKSLIQLPVNQHPDGWRMNLDKENRVTLIGSILQMNCKAHYIITKNIANFC